MRAEMQMREGGDCEEESGFFRLNLVLLQVKPHLFLSHRTSVFGRREVSEEVTFRLLSETYSLFLSKSGPSLLITFIVPEA